MDGLQTIPHHASDDGLSYKGWFGPDEPRSEKPGGTEAEGVSVLGNIWRQYMDPFPVSTPESVRSGTDIDYSVLGRLGGGLNELSVASVGLMIPVPLQFMSAHVEMLSFCSFEAGWDGEESQRISEEAVTQALLFLGLLPHDIPSPEASPANDGTVDWYWRIGKNAATVTFLKDGTISYFSMTDNGSVNGSFKLNGSIPSELIESLRQFE